MALAACKGGASGSTKMAATVDPLMPTLATESKPEAGSITRPPTMARSKD